MIITIEYIFKGTEATYKELDGSLVAPFLGQRLQNYMVNSLEVTKGYLTYSYDGELITMGDLKLVYADNVDDSKPEVVTTEVETPEAVITEVTEPVAVPAVSVRATATKPAAKPPAK